MDSVELENGLNHSDDEEEDEDEYLTTSEPYFTLQVRICFAKGV